MKYVTLSNPNLYSSSSFFFDVSGLFPVLVDVSLTFLTFVEVENPFVCKISS
jgi:hypothetical protein